MSTRPKEKSFAFISYLAVLLILPFDVWAGNPPPRVHSVAPACAAPGETVSVSGHGFGAHNVKIKVGGELSEVSMANGHSAEFIVPSSSTPGNTTITVVNPGGQGGTIDFQVKGAEICGNGIDDDCDGEVDEVDECPLASLDVDTSPFDITLAPGEVGNIATTVNFSTTGSNTFHIVVTQEVAEVSGPASGINISPNVVGGFTTSMDQTTVDNQEITAVSEGVYQITTTGKISETGEVKSSLATVRVVSNLQTLGIGVPGSDPGGVAPDTSTQIVFTAQVQGTDNTNSVNVLLTGDLSTPINLNDQGVDGDIAPNDGTFSGTTIIDTTGKVAGTCLEFFASATQGTTSVTSDPYQLCVSSLPLELDVLSNLTNPVIDPVSGEPAVADEVLIHVVQGTLDPVISQIAGSVGGTVVGAIPGLNVYQVRLQNPVLNSAELAQIISDLESFPEVIQAEANVIDEGQAVTPSDTQFSSQGGLTKIRADEAWTIARGTRTIAVVDSGADLNHPDLASKIIKGKDFVDGDNDPEDEHGHGTHVAGIAGAVTNNSQGIAGVSWGSKILVVRVFGSSGTGTAAGIASGIKHAADRGARIINISGGGTGGQTVKCSAVSYAVTKKSMMIAAAGNNGNSTQFYPAACAGAIAVGNTTLSDSRASTSNFGSWVDLAAPGTNILSTVPVGGTCTHCNSTGYKQLSGTSMAAPMVAGAAAVVMSRQPVLTNSEVETRLKRTAVKLPSANLGDGRIDLFEAVFNGSFEEGNLALWTRLGTASSKKILGGIMPQDRERMGSVSTGPAGAQTAGTLIQGFTIQPGVASFPITFKYAFVTEEYPEFVGTQFDDSLKITLVTPSGSEIILAEESVNGSSFTGIGGIDFPGGDTTVGWTGWKTVTKTIPVTGGSGVYKIFLTDAGDAIYDTETLIDGIQFK